MIKFVVGLVIFFGFIGIMSLGYVNKKVYTVTITEKIIKNSNKSSRYLVYTRKENGKIKVFENTDLFLIGKFDSSDIQARLKVGSKYVLRTRGYRFPMLSMYENIVTASKSGN